MSKAIVLPSGETSREIHDASSVVNLSERVVMSGSELARVAARTALSFCAAVCAPSCGAAAAESSRTNVNKDGQGRLMRRSPLRMKRWVETWYVRRRPTASGHEATAFLHVSGCFRLPNQSSHSGTLLGVESGLSLDGCGPTS